MLRVWCFGFLTAGVFAGALVMAQQRPAQEPQAIGAPQTVTISFGDEYTSFIELYDARITVLEVVRGEKALSRLRAANSSIGLTRPGFEYLLAHIKFEFSARGAPGDKRYLLKKDQFVAISGTGSEYPALPLVQSPQLEATLRSGEVSEGWITFAAAHTDKKPLLVFKEDVQTPLLSGSGVRLKLY